MTSLQTLKGLISQRLCVAAEEIFILVERILTEYEELHLCSKQQPQYEEFQLCSKQQPQYEEVVVHTELQPLKPHTAEQEMEHHQRPEKAKGQQSKALRGAATYRCSFKAEWTRTWPFITQGSLNNYYWCSICRVENSCAHQGKADIQRHVASKSHQDKQRALQSTATLDGFPVPVPAVGGMSDQTLSAVEVMQIELPQTVDTGHTDMMGDLLPLPVCKEEVSSEQRERSPSLVQEEWQQRSSSPQVKKEELLQRPEEAESWSTLALPVKREDDDDENRETEPLAGTSTEDIQTQAYMQYWGAKPPDDVQPLSSHCSVSDITEDSDEWEEPTEDQSALDTLRSHKTQCVEGQRLSFRNDLSQDLDSSRRTLSTESHLGKKRYSCTVCGRCFGFGYDLKRHMRIHTGEKPFRCTICSKNFSRNYTLKVHMRAQHMD